MKDKRGINFKDTVIAGNRISSLDKDFLERLNDGVVEHPLQIGELTGKVSEVEKICKAIK